MIQIIDVTGTPPVSGEKQILALGKFDGVHIGHQEILRVTRDLAKGELVSVMSFWPHPAWALARKPGYDRALTPRDEQAAVLESLGIDRLYRVEFTREYATTSAEEFVTEHLSRLNLTGIVVGMDFTFGKGGTATAEVLAELSRRIDVPVHIVGAVEENGLKVSSSQIRAHIESGRVEAAEALLSRPYSIIGAVAHGQELGRKLGFPTANLMDVDEYVMPQAGVYAVSVEVLSDGTERQAKPSAMGSHTAAIGSHSTATGSHTAAIGSHSTSWFGVLNAGYRPTVDGTRFQVEVHLLDFAGDLYDKSLRISFLARVRDERKFESLDALKAQIHSDANHVRQLFGLGLTSE